MERRFGPPFKKEEGMVVAIAFLLFCLIMMGMFMVYISIDDKRSQQKNDPLQIARRRCAEGEISEDELFQLESTLRATAPRKK